MVDAGVLTEEDLSLINIDKIQRAVIKADLKSIADKTLYKEKNFLYLLPAKSFLEDGSDEKVLIQGVIDLLAIDGDNAVIIDYKYSGADKKTLYNRYAKQLEIYGEAVEKVLRKKVIKKIVVSLITGEAVEI